MKRLQRNGCFLLALIVLCALGAAEQSAQYYYDQAVGIDKSGDTLKATDMVREALRKNGNHVPSLLLMARLSQQAQQPKLASQLITKALGLEKQNEAAFILCARVEYALRNTPAMENCLAQAEKLKRNNADAQSLRAQLLIDGGQFSIARRKIEGILRDNPGHTETQLRLASLYLKLRQFEKAEAQFRKVQTLLPESSELAVAIARARLDAYFESARLNLFASSEESSVKALDALRHAHANNPENLAVNLMLAQLLAVTNRCSEAGEYLARVAGADAESRSIVAYVSLCAPGSEQAVKLLGDFVRRNEDDDLARHQYELTLVAQNKRRETAATTKAARYHRQIAKRESDRNADEFALSELRWTEFLFPAYIEAHRDLLKYFRQRKDFERLADELTFLRDSTGDQAYREMFEQFEIESRDLWYRKAGVTQPERVKNLLPVHIFPFRVKNPLNDHPLGGVAVADRTRVALQDFGRVRSISREMAALPQAQAFSPENLRRLRQTYSDALKGEANTEAFQRRTLSLVLTGEVSELMHGIEVIAELVDAETGIRVAEIRFKAEGREYLNKAAVRLAEFVYANAPVSANVLKILDDDQILVNAGKRDGITNATKFVVTDKLGKALEFKIEQKDFDILRARSTDAMATRHLKAGDVVRVLTPPAPLSTK
ncbi:tetratricopeptide repeat protein [Turneriella parva]|uniref:Tetratricopeptide TPR_1 repeat-containing protein n=1 Tax=Turneriella parva (strain ATCC BAA-1111 / DSM 21527 / NCTC 11395 / H) TaxID=869212 RepID=I4BB03_TURPD|nr:tetratricopeptide repeat protein [Turneriella parva]AFM14460.1 Tetratricopeptide TPR_1 repeat-containing protein [Turneriella parva DSM 21527]